MNYSLIVMSQQWEYVNLIESNICKCEEYCKLKISKTPRNPNHKFWGCARLRYKKKVVHFKTFGYSLDFLFCYFRIIMDTIIFGVI